MVDFQSRDTRRGADDEEEEEDDAASETESNDDAAVSPSETAETAESAEGGASDVAAGGSTEQTTDDSTAVDADEESATAGAESEPDGASSDPLAPDSVGETETDPTTGSSSPTEAEPATSETHERGDAPVDAAEDAEPVADYHGTESGHGHSHEGHDHGVDVGTLGIAVVTVTSSRTRESDSSGDTIVEHVEASDHEVVTREVVADDLDGVQRTVLSITGRDDVDAVVTTGGTGVTPDDVTVEAVEPLFDKHLPGFGELFRFLSYEEVGTRAISSRATAGISEGVPVFCLPGSVDAVRLAMAELVSEELAHLVGLATREE